MEVRWSFVVLWAAFFWTSGSANTQPALTEDMNNLPLSESTPVGQVVYTLKGTDPKGRPVKYGLVGTDKFSVDPDTGAVTLVQPLDREINDTIKFLVSIRNEDNEGQTEPVTVIVWDENDNPPTFTNSPYEVDVPEDEEVGRTILQKIVVEDKDSVGDNLEVGCVPNEQWPEACEIFEVVTLQSSANYYAGALVLKKHLDYNEKQFYQFQLSASDGALNSTAAVEVKVVDVQNSPPVFSGALSAALPEDAPVGTLALRVQARDGDRAQPRPVAYELLTSTSNILHITHIQDDSKIIENTSGQNTLGGNLLTTPPNTYRLSTAECSSMMAQCPEMLLNNILSKVTELQTQFLAIQTIQADISQVKCDLSEMKNSIDTKLDELGGRMTTIESRVTALEGCKTELDDVKRIVSDVINDARKNEQWVRRSNVQINGVPEVKGENLFSIVRSLAELGGFPLNTNSDIDFVTRVAVRNDVDNSKPKPIIVKFQARYKKDDFISSLRKLKNLKAADLGFASSTNRVYVNDHLSSFNKHLLKLAKHKANQKQYQFCWVRNCTVMVRRDEKSPILYITTEEALNKIT